jgi:hypothetical protein
MEFKKQKILILLFVKCGGQIHKYVIIRNSKCVRCAVYAYISKATS